MVGVVVGAVCFQDLTLKVSGQYLSFWLSYSGSLIKLLTCQRREKREERDIGRQVILVVALPNAMVGQKATVGQGLPNSVIVIQRIKSLLSLE